MKCRLGLIGNGYMIRNEYIPYLKRRIEERSDIEIGWASGCLCSERERINCPLKELGWKMECVPGREEDWRWLLDNTPVHAVLVSLPNFLHHAPIEEALNRGVNVTVDKPTTIRSDDCGRLVRLAAERDLVFVTQAQRRYEDVYQIAAEKVRSGALGDIVLINYMIAHEYFGREVRDWTTSRSRSGGGALISSGYHGIDTVLWLLRQCPEGEVRAKSVSASWRLDCHAEVPQDAIETIAVARIALDNGGIFNATASFENPPGSLDENIKIFGTRGAIRIMRDRAHKSDQSAALLSFQDHRGDCTEYDTSQLTGRRWAPLENFLDAVLCKLQGRPWSVLSPARDSLQTIQIIEEAYKSAQQGGREILLMNSHKVQVIHHIAVQTSDFEKALHFYLDILGADLVRRREFKKRDLAWLRVGGTTIELFSKRRGEELEPWSDFYSGPVHIAFSVEEFDAFLQTAIQRGAQFHPSHPGPFVPPVDGAQKIAYLLGPDGEEVEIRSATDLT